MQEEKLTYEMVQNMGLPNIIAYAAPVMITLVIIEWVISYYQNKDKYDGKDTIAATAVGLVNVALGASIKIVTFGLAIFFYNLVPWNVPPTWWSFILCIVWIDFWRYVSHRIGHESRFWWATHVTHHSSKKYNLSVSFRLGWTQYLKVIFFIPVFLVGFNPVVFFICHQIEVLYQFWIHSAYINKLPRPIEYIFTTPSHHRVHHATNPQYIDKNYGSTLIIWDRMFGTFEPEVEKPVYGITKELEKPYNPVYLCFHEWMDIIRDIRKAKSIKQAWTLTFSSPTRISELQEEGKLPSFESERQNDQSKKVNKKAAA
ncbi:sterol desaturase family protein [Mangrovivirga sp. M17]|uniref:Sterol desaturase family protein n=1 Tax=Mangrovivirga halotolerans TaxID=2993936 RepID=A0ABT3RRP8_9BACT|nr:sterol desaturase family protein [Mangrovivirga halotolerans]MCX2744228.1 sterol desaturase family protein [Mangrovivirga halotolerans]